MTKVVGKISGNWQWEHNADNISKGRILVGWHPQRYQFQMIMKTDQLIHGQAIQLSTNKRFFITFVYGKNLEAQRLPLWRTLCSLASNMNDSWCVMGDFNSILHQGERIGGSEVTANEMQDFGNCINTCGLQEFNYIGAFFTWTSRTIWSRIDRALHNSLWFDTFDFTHVVYQAQGLSDHSPISLDLPTCPKPRRSFQFCDMWVKDP